MRKIKVAFFDTKEFEEKILMKNKPEECEFILINEKFRDGFEKNYDKVKDAEILSVFTNSKVPSEYLKKLPDLRLIATRSTGYNNIDIEYCNSAEISVVNVPGYGACTVAEYAFALILNVSRRVSQAYDELKKGKINLQNCLGIDLAGKTIGIIGTGSIGCYAAKIAYGFGMKILTYDPFPKQDLKERFSVEYKELDELLKKSDIISLHAPLTSENFHMLNEKAFSIMKNGVIIVNTARGELIDTNALYQALKSGKVAGAGLDVVECEEILGNEDFYLAKMDSVHKDCLEKTLINHKLLEMPNVIITPHIAFDTMEAVERILNTTVENINGYLRGNLVNKVN